MLPYHNLTWNLTFNGLEYLHGKKRGDFNGVRIILKEINYEHYKLMQKARNTENSKK